MSNNGAPSAVPLVMVLGAPGPGWGVRVPRSRAPRVGLRHEADVPARTHNRPLAPRCAMERARPGSRWRQLQLPGVAMDPVAGTISANGETTELVPGGITHTKEEA